METGSIMSVINLMPQGDRQIVSAINQLTLIITQMSDEEKLNLDVKLFDIITFARNVHKLLA